MKKLYLVWNMTNYGVGYEILGLYTTKAKAEKAYRKEMKNRYGTTNFDKLLDLWDDTESGCADCWHIDSIEIKE